MESVSESCIILSMRGNLLSTSSEVNAGSLQTTSMASGEYGSRWLEAVERDVGLVGKADGAHASFCVLGLGQVVSDFPALHFETLVRVHEGGHTRAFRDGFVVVVYVILEYEQV